LDFFLKFPDAKRQFFFKFLNKICHFAEVDLEVETIDIPLLLLFALVTVWLNVGGG
jgi:hypothetical protein